MNLAELRDAIRVEVGLKDADSYTATLDRLINATFRKYTGMNKYPEMRMEATLPVVTAQTGYNLPVDFQLFESFFYNDVSVNLLGRSLRSSKRRGVLSDVAPRYVEIIGGALFVLPGQLITSTDTLVLKYYGFVELLDDIDEHPLRALEDVVINAVTGRMLFIIDNARAKGAMQLERDAFNKLRAEYAGKS